MTCCDSLGIKNLPNSHFDMLIFFFQLLQENEQFKKLEKKRLEREKKEADEKARREKLGIKDEPKKRGRPPPVEEKCIIDNLLDEIKNGFPLRKSQVTSPEKSPTKKNKHKAKQNWKKSKMLASFISTLLCVLFCDVTLIWNGNVMNKKTFL